MTRIVVDPDALAGAGRAVSGVGDELAAAVATLSSSLGGGAPSGMDAAGLAFGMAYQKSATALLDAGAALVNAGHNVGFGVAMSATNYSQADAASTVGGGAAPLTAPEKPAKFDTPSCPSSLGGGVPPPFMWSILQTFIPDTWPDGDPGRLRASAQAWQSFASAIRGIAGELSGPTEVVAGQKIPEGGAMTSAMSELSQSLSQVAAEAGNLATQTGEFADDVQSTQDAIRDLCDRISPSGIFDGIKAVFSGDALDEIKEIADDVQQVLENFGRQVDGRISLMESLITALDDAVVSLQQGARREFTHYLGDDVGGALATALEFQSNVGEGVIKAGLETVVGIQQLDPMRFASDPEGASAAWGGVLDTLKYATPTGLAADPVGAFEHGKDRLGGIVHAEDWRADRPGLGLGGVLFEAGSAATGVGAAKTGLRGVSAAAEAGEAGPAVRAAAGAAESTAPIAGRASEIAGKLDDLTTLTDDIPGATAGTHGPTLPSALAETDVPRVPDMPRLPETPAPHDVPDVTGPRSVPDAPGPRSAELPPQHVPDAGAPRTSEIPLHNAPDPGASRASEPSTTSSSTVAREDSRPPVAAPQITEPLPSGSPPEPPTVRSDSGAPHSAELPPSPVAPHGPSESHPAPAHSPASVAPESHPSSASEGASSSGQQANHDVPDGAHGGRHHDDGAYPHPGDDGDLDPPRWDRNVVSDDMRAHILEMDKGSRPDPSDYLPQQFIEHHLERFDDGASRFMTAEALEDYGIGHRDGTTYVFPTRELENLMEATGGDRRALEQALGLPDGYFDVEGVVRVDVPSPETYDLRIPSGNEAGTNDQWIPGGFLPTGMPEAVIDGADVPPGDLTITDLDGE